MILLRVLFFTILAPNLFKKFDILIQLFRIHLMTNDLSGISSYGMMLGILL